MAAKRTDEGYVLQAVRSVLSYDRPMRNHASNHLALPDTISWKRGKETASPERRNPGCLLEASRKTEISGNIPFLHKIKNLIC